ncbi:hypothetical protein PENTCL1PPCAC_7892 [Pristionchus entomophagus]|uniref:Uncharacterized protein n=1 Tax=Pristionchus entomophagus TaxID=358040 RepID=A0AAV5SSG1_9BILA|nr:hypothetical protein PENTCL1PPCAC_7892 [Pristionchus entomophagus]
MICKEYACSVQMFNILIDEFEVFACKVESVEGRTSHWSNRLFRKLGLVLLVLYDVRLIMAEVRVVNNFPEACTFDKLTVHLAQNQCLCKKIDELFSKTVKGVDIIVQGFVPSPDQFMSISRPVWIPDNDEMFLEVIRITVFNSCTFRLIQHILLSKQSKRCRWRQQLIRQFTKFTKFTTLVRLLVSTFCRSRTHHQYVTTVLPMNMVILVR